MQGNFLSDLGWGSQNIGISPRGREHEADRGVLVILVHLRNELLTTCGERVESCRPRCR